MAKVNLATIKNWFRTGLKPTQAQFWDTWDSFFHKDEKIPIDSIENITQILLDKADAEALTAHNIAADAHSALFNNKVDKVEGMGLSQNNLTHELVAMINTANDSTENKVLDYSLRWLGGYKYEITVRKYALNGLLHIVNIVAERTLEAADPNFNRFDTPVIDEFEEIIIIKGDASAFPYPKEYDYDTQVFITFLRVDAGTTEPIGVSEVLWYNENLQEAGGEKNTSINSGTATLASADFPSTGGVSIKLLNKASAWVKSTEKYLGKNLSNVVMEVTCKTATNNRLWLQLWINNTMRLGQVYITHGTFNFDAFLIDVPQTITIPGSAFMDGASWGNLEYQDLFVGNDKSGTTVFVDNIRFQQGLGSTSVPSGQLIERTSQIPINDGSDGVNPFITQLDIINDLVTGGIGKGLSAQQGVILKSQIDAIYVLLGSDNINLDTVQEIVDAIETVQMSLSTILVNDLTTGGTTKALTAEMGKTLKGLVDALTTVVNGKQDALGIVTTAATAYTFALTDPNKNVTFTAATAVTATIPTNAVTAIPIGSRIGVTQSGNGVVSLVTTGLTVISASPLYLIKGQTVYLVKTAINTWTIEGNNLNGEVRFPAYPSTRDDGVNPTNKVFAPDTLGNMKLYKQGVFPAPYIDIVVPDSTLPSTTGNFELYGSFFTPTMLAVFTGQTVNYIVFHTTNWVTVNVTTGAGEGLFSITLDNGLSKTFTNAYMVVLGTVFKPLTAEWTLTEPVEVLDDSVMVQTYSSIGKAVWSKEFNYLINWSFRCKIKSSPLGNVYSSNYTEENILLRNISNVERHSINFYTQTPTRLYLMLSNNNGAFVNNGAISFTDNNEYEYRCVAGILYFYKNNVLLENLGAQTQNLKVEVNVRQFDVFSIKYIELAM